VHGVPESLGEAGARSRCGRRERVELPENGDEDDERRGIHREAHGGTAEREEDAAERGPGETGNVDARGVERDRLGKPVPSGEHPDEREHRRQPEGEADPHGERCRVDHRRGGELEGGQHGEPSRADGLQGEAGDTDDPPVDPVGELTRISREHERRARATRARAPTAAGLSVRS
jgi:hypothetical protein